MSDITLSFDFPGVKEGEQAVKMLDSLHSTLKSGAGAGKSLEEMRKILVGMKGQASVLTDLRDAVKGLNTATSSMSKSFEASIGGLSRVMKSELAQLRSTMLTSGQDSGKAFGTGLTSGMESSTVEMTKKFRSMAAKAKAEATQMYQDMVSNQPMAKIKDMGALLQLKEAGATLSPYHKSILDAWEKNGQLTYQTRVKWEKAAQAEVDRLRSARTKSATGLKGEDAARSMLGLPSDSEMQRATAKLKAQMQEVQNIRNQVDKATLSARGAYSSINTKEVLRPEDLRKTTTEAGNLDNAFKKLTISGGDLHGMARGLASGFGLLWLTWGNMAPLFAGAAISHGFVQTAKTGMELGHTLQTIAVLGENSAKEVGGLKQELIALGKSGPFGPTAVAEAMKTLSLAGLKADEIRAVTKTVVDFAVAGDTAVQSAADTLMSVTTAFGMGAAGFARAADIMTVGAAESRASVETFSRAMKQAAPVAALYGVSLEDVTVQIAALTQIGIDGSAAGTMLRNAYSDLAGRTPKVVKALKSVGLELQNTNGEFPKALELMTKISQATEKLTGKAREQFLNAVFSERGMKSGVANLKQFEKAVKDTGGNVTTAMADITKKVEESWGKTTIYAAKMNLTLKSQWAAVGATLQTSMVQAFDSLGPSLLLITARLKEVFGSPEFVSSIATATEAIARIGVVIIENESLLKTLAAGYLTYKGIMLSFAVAQGLVASGKALLNREMVIESGLLAANTTAASANAAAVGASAGANAAKVGALAGLARFLPYVGQAITLASIAWMGYEYWNSKASDTAKKADDFYNNSLMKSLQDEIDKLAEINSLRAQGLSKAEAQQRFDDRRKGEAIAGPSENALLEAQKQAAAAKKEFEEAQAAADKFKKTVNKPGDKPSDLGGPMALDWAAKARAMEKLQNATQTLSKATKGLTAAEQDYAKVQGEVKAKQDTLIEERRKEAAKDAKELAELQRTFGTQLLPVEPKGPGRIKPVQLLSDNELASIAKQYSTLQSEMQDAASKERQILEAKQQAHLISEGRYQAELFNLVQGSEQKQLDLIQSNREAYAKAYTERALYLAGQLEEALKRSGGAESDNVKTVRQAIENLGNTAESVFTKFSADASKINTEAFMRLEIAAIKAQGAIYTLSEENRKFWQKDAAEVSKSKALDKVGEKYRFISDSVFDLRNAEKAADEARATAFEKYAERLVELQVQYKQAKDDADSFMLMNFEPILAGNEAVGKSYDQLQAKVLALTKIIEEFKAKSAAGVDVRADIAYQKARAAQLDKFGKDLSDVVITGITDGGEAASKKLRKLLQDELWRKPLTMLVQATVTGLTQQVLGGTGGGAGGLLNLLPGGNTGLGGLLSSGLTGLGSLTGSMALTNVGLGMVAPPLSSAALAAGAMGPAATGVAGSIGGAISSALPYLGLALGAISLLGGLGKGESRTGGQYGVAFDGAITNRRRGETYTRVGQQFNEDKGLTTLLTSGKAYLQEAHGLGAQGDKDITNAMEATAKNIDSMLKALGSTRRLTAFFGGLETSGKGRGGVMAGGELTGGILFGDTGTGTNVGGNFYRSEFSRSPDMQQALKDFQTVLVQVQLQALQAVGTELPKTISSMLEGVDIASLSQDSAAALLQQIADQIAAVEALTTALDAMPMANLKNLSFDAASGLIKFAGGLDKLTSDLATYYEKFYSEEERSAQMKKNVDKGLADIGITGVDTMKKFRALVEAQDASTEAGQKLIAQLLGLAGSFAEVYGASKSAEDELNRQRDIDNKKLDLTIQLLRLEGREVEAVALERQRELDALKDFGQEVIDLQKRIYALEDAIKGTDDAYALLERSVNKQKEILQGQLDVAEELVNTLSGLFKVLSDGARDLYNQTQSTKDMSFMQGRLAIAQAREIAVLTGYLPEEAAMSSAIGAVSGGFTSERYSSQFEADRARLQTAGQLQDMADLAGHQLTSAEEQVASLKKQIEQLDLILAQAKDQLDALRGIDTSVIGVQAAIDRFQRAMADELAVRFPEKTKPLEVTGSREVFGPSQDIGPREVFGPTPLSNKALPLPPTLAFASAVPVTTRSGEDTFGQAAILEELSLMRQDNKAVATAQTDIMLRTLKLQQEIVDEGVQTQGGAA